MHTCDISMNDVTLSNPKKVIQKTRNAIRNTCPKFQDAKIDLTQMDYKFDNNLCEAIISV